MAKFQFKWDYKAAGDLLLRSKEMADFCESEAAKMTQATGMDYEPDVYFGKSRVNAGAFKGHDGNES